MIRSVIPKNIFLRNPDPEIKYHNPEFAYYYYHRHQTKILLCKEFPKIIVSLYDTLSDNSIFELWKLCVLYVYGGIYLDNGYSCNTGFKLIELTYKEHFVKKNNEFLSGTLIACLPKNKIVYRAIVRFNGFIKYKPHLITANLLNIDTETESILLEGKYVLNKSTSYDNVPYNYASNHDFIPPVYSKEPLRCEDFNSLNDTFNFDYENTFCISLNNRIDRWEAFSNRAKFIGLKVTRWIASEPKDVTDIFLNNLTPVEKACGQSHINIWKHIIDNNLEYAFIMEDDACFDRRFFEKLLDLSNMLHQHTNWDGVFLNALGIFKTDKFFEWFKASNQYMTGGYIISNSGAKFIIDSLKDKYVSSDHMTMTLQERGKCFTYCPWLIIQEGKNSDIQTPDHIGNVIKIINDTLKEVNYSFDNSHYIINPPILPKYIPLKFTKKNTFCINLESRGDRWEKFCHRANTIDLPFSRWSASSPTNITDIFLDKLTMSEKACAQSHINIWKHIIDNNMEYAFILEDDVCFDRRIFDKLLSLNEILEVDENWDAIFLNSINYLTPTELFKWRKSYDQSLCGGYILSIRGAKYMIDCFTDKYDCSDTMTIALQDKGHCYTYFPWLIVQENLESNIQKPAWLGYINKMVRTQLIKSCYEFNDENYVISTRKKLVLIIVWFGELPRYFDTWILMIKNKEYDVLLVTDQYIDNIPTNIKCVSMSLPQFNRILNKKTGFNVNINKNKIPDIKPLYGILFYEFIGSDYQFWGWTDLDIVVGDDVITILNEYQDYEAYIFGHSNLRNFMVFSIYYVEFYKEIKKYEYILNDKNVYNMHHILISEKFDYTSELDIYKYENIDIKYYSDNSFRSIVHSNHIIKEFSDI